MSGSLIDLLFAPAFTLWGSAQTWLELVAFVLALAMVACNMRVNVWGWPLAIASSLLYFALFWRSRLYGDAGLQLFFVALAGWGWQQWLRGMPVGDAPVRSLGARGRMWCLAAFVVAWPATGALLLHVTDTDVPWWDAFPTAGSVVGQWLLGRKYVENWLVWLAVNVAGTSLYAYKGLWLTVVLYVVFAVLSLVGWRAWRRLARAGPDASATPVHALPGAA